MCDPKVRKRSLLYAVKIQSVKWDLTGAALGDSESKWDCLGLSLQNEFHRAGKEGEWQPLASALVAVTGTKSWIWRKYFLSSNDVTGIDSNRSCYFVWGFKFSVLQWGVNAIYKIRIQLFSAETLYIVGLH